MNEDEEVAGSIITEVIVSEHFIKKCITKCLRESYPAIQGEIINITVQEYVLDSWVAVTNKVRASAVFIQEVKL